MMNPIIFYDGDCALCNHSILFLLKADTTEELRYAPLNGATTKKLLGPNYKYVLEKDTVTLLYKDQLYTETEAIIQSLRIINQWLWLAKLISIFPQSFRNRVYRFTARHRSKIFKTCPVIPHKYSHLFL